ncbi:hypothetical protein RI367_005421 [Sorochytrium milnesiophthora]
MADAMMFSPTPDERTSFEAIFLGSGGRDGKLEGRIMADLLRRTGLPNEMLSRVWQLSLSAQANNKSVSPDDFSFARFVVATYVVPRLMDGRINVNSMPLALPPQFLQGVDALVATSQFAASHRPQQPPPQQPLPGFGTINKQQQQQQQQPVPASPAVNLLDDFAPVSTPSSPGGLGPGSGGGNQSFSSLQPVRAHSTGYSTVGRPTSPQTLQQASPLPMHRTGPAMQSSGPTASSMSIMSNSIGAISSTPTSDRQEWDVTADEQSRFGKFFDDLDRAKRGFVTGAECVGFFGRSNLPQPVLSQIWMLADLDKKGQLDREQFMLAMHLIQKKMQGVELPGALPVSLVPPSRRQPTQQTTGSLNFNDAFGGPPPAMQRRNSNSSIKSVMPPKNGGFGTSFEDMLAGSTARPNAAPTAATATTYGSGNILSAAANTQSTPILPQATGDLAGYQSKLNTLRDQRGDLNMQQAALVGQKQDLMLQLNSVKAMYESEQSIIAEVKAVVDRERGVVDGLRRDIQQLEQTRAELQTERATLEQTIQRDRAEAELLKNKIVSLNFDINSMRMQVDRLREDAKREAENKTFNGQIVGNLESVERQVGSDLEAAKREAAAAKAKAAAAPPAPAPAPAPAVTKPASPVIPAVTAAAPVQPANVPMPASPDAKQLSFSSTASTPAKSAPAAAAPVGGAPNWDELRNVDPKSTSVFGSSPGGDASPSKAFEQEFPSSPTKEMISSVATTTATAPRPTSQTGLGFDDDFSLPASTTAAAAAPAPKPSSATAPTFAFDDVFGDAPAPAQQQPTSQPSLAALGRSNTMSAKPAVAFDFDDVFTTSTPIPEHKTGPAAIKEQRTGASAISTTSAPAPKTVAAAVNFDAEFDSAMFGAPAGAMTAKSTSAPTSANPTKPPVDFASEFDQLSMGAPTPAAAPTAKPPATSAPFNFPSASAFDPFPSAATPAKATSGFDDAFGPSSSAAPAPAASKPTGAPAAAFGFDDAFGSPAPPANNGASSATPAPDFFGSTPAAPLSPTQPAPTGSPTMAAAHIDGSHVTEIMNMGFTKAQAEEALRRYDNSVERALNFLLGG